MLHLVRKNVIAMGSINQNMLRGAGGGTVADHMGNLATSLQQDSKSNNNKNNHIGSSRSFASTAMSRYNKKRQERKVLNSQVHRKPTIQEARAMPNSFAEYDNQALLAVAGMDHHLARIEVLKRHIMAVDNVSYDEACQTFKVIEQKNREWMTVAALPYQIGIALAVTAGFGSLPMVFDIHTALPFNEAFVTTDVPDDRDLETFLEVGAWTWSWMEPVIGTFSFVLLCLQFSRAQMENLGIHPYTSKLKSIRAKKLAAQFPRYDSYIIYAFSESDPIIHPKDAINTTSQN